MLQNIVQISRSSKARLSKLIGTQDRKFRGRVLLVEDQPIVRQVNCAFLKSLHCQVDVASNGKEALSLMCCEYDLIFLDIGLPDIKGTTVCQRIRQQKERHIPIIALTACDAFKKECDEADFDEFVLKPISLPALKWLLDKWL